MLISGISGIYLFKGAFCPTEDHDNFTDDLCPHLQWPSAPLYSKRHSVACLWRHSPAHWYPGMIDQHTEEFWCFQGRGSKFSPAGADRTSTAFDSSAGRTIAQRPQAFCQHGSGMFQTTCSPGVLLNTNGSTLVYGAPRGTQRSSFLGSTKSYFLKSGKIGRFVVIFIWYRTQRDNHHTLNMAPTRSIFAAVLHHVWIHT